jgi:Rv0078B-related antitoxin
MGFEVNIDGPDLDASSQTFGVAVASDLFETALQMRATRHRREHPNATDAEVEAVVLAWKTHRPGAPNGDADGRPIDWPRR